MVKIITLLLILNLLLSCDCLQEVTGTIIDYDTGLPLGGTEVYNKKRNRNTIKTDSTGNFKLTAISGGFGCPPMTVVAELKNYMQTEVEIESGEYKIIKMKAIDPLSKSTLERLQGIWYHDQDSSATVEVISKTWTFNYKSAIPGAYDVYSIVITDELTEYASVQENAEFLVLINNKDSLEFEILNLTDSTLSLMYFPAGRIHLYKRNK